MPDQDIQGMTVSRVQRDLPRLSVFGLGKLGAPMAAVFAAAGFDVIGYDLNTAYVDSLASGEAPVEETGLQEMIDGAKGKLTAVHSTEEAIANTDVTFVIVPTPCGPDGEFINDYVLAAVRDIGAAIQTKDSPHTVVITSTVMPGATGGVIASALEQAAGRELGIEGLGLCYSPEFIALGSVIRDMQYPDFILIGESDPEAGALLQSIYDTACANAPKCYRMNFVNAELAKISVNTFVTTKISYANMLADICSKLDGADVDVVTNAVGADSRIGKKYLKGAVSYGGPCFPRDNRAFSALGDRLGANCGLAKATDALNNAQVARLVAAVKAVSDSAQSVAVLGLSYKPDTHVIEQSAGIDLVRALKKENYRVVAHDPQANVEARRIADIADTVCDSLVEVMQKADVLVLTTPWKEYATLGDFGELSNVQAIVDPWRILEPATISPSVNLLSLGRTS